MPIGATDARRIQGQFQHALNGHQPPSQDARNAARWPLARQVMRVDNRAQLLTLMCLAASLRAPTVLAGRPGAVGPAASPEGSSALLPGTRAVPHRYQPVGQMPARPTLGMQLSGIANMAATTCAVHPRHCAAALGTGVLLAAGAATAALLPGRSPTPGRTPTALPPHLSPNATDQARDSIRNMRITDARTGKAETVEHALLQALKSCHGDAHCLQDAIRTLVQQLPPQDQHALHDVLDTDAVTQTPAAGLLPGAQALPLIPEHWLGEVVDLLAQLYTTDEASYLLDLETIVQATCGGLSGQLAPCDLHEGDNASRMQMIQRLLEDAGLHVDAHAYSTTAHDAQGQAHTTSSVNLLASRAAAGAPAPRRTLLLVAHGDMIGTGSTGAYDNASGVATLLHIMRRLDGAAMPDGTQLQLLITSGEETDLMGATAFVQECLQARSCPTMTVNIDLVGRGGKGYMMSGSEVIDRVYLNAGQARQDPTGTVLATEAAASALLDDTFRQHGFVRQLASEDIALPSDNVAFQRHGVPALGLAQASEEDARQFKQYQDAGVARQKALGAIRWDEAKWLLDQGNHTLSDTEQARSDALHHSIDGFVAADDHYNAVFEALPEDGLLRVIHTGRDQLDRVDPAMALAFGDALADFARRWGDAPPIALPSTMPARTTPPRRHEHAAWLDGPDDVRPLPPGRRRPHAVPPRQPAQDRPGTDA